MKGSKSRSSGNSKKGSPKPELDVRVNDVSRSKYKVSHRKSNISHIVLDKNDEDEILALLTRLALLDGDTDIDNVSSNCAATSVGEDENAVEVVDMSDDETDPKHDSINYSSDDDSPDVQPSRALRKKLISKLVRDDRRIQAATQLEKFQQRAEMKAKRAAEFNASNGPNSTTVATNTSSKSKGSDSSRRMGGGPLRLQISTEKKSSKVKVVVVNRDIDGAGLLEIVKHKMQASKRYGILRVCPSQEELEDDMICTLPDDTHIMLCIGSSSSVGHDRGAEGSDAPPAIPVDGAVTRGSGGETFLGAAEEHEGRDDGQVLVVPEGASVEGVGTPGGGILGGGGDVPTDGSTEGEGHPTDERFLQPNKAISKKLRAQRMQVIETRMYREKILPSRQQLPMCNAQGDFLEMMKANNALIVVGDTGELYYVFRERMVDDYTYGGVPIPVLC